MREGPLAGQRVRVETQLVIGRVDADITLDDPLVSRRHAVIRPSGDALEVEDLGSLNGTWVNGRRLEERRARPFPPGLDAAELRALRTRAVRELPARLLALAAEHGLVVSRVSVRNQRWRWGSCSRAGHICLN